MFIAQIGILSLTLVSFASVLVTVCPVLFCKCCSHGDDAGEGKEQLLVRPEAQHVSFHEPPVTSISTYDPATGEVLTVAI